MWLMMIIFKLKVGTHHKINLFPLVPRGGGNVNLLDLPTDRTTKLVIRVAVPHCCVNNELATHQSELQRNKHRIQYKIATNWSIMIFITYKKPNRRLHCYRLIDTVLRGDPLKIDLYSSTNKLCNFSDTGNNQLLFQAMAFSFSFALCALSSVWQVRCKQAALFNGINTLYCW